MQIDINIWDDYHDDGYVPVGEIQETYAYIESKIEETECKNVLEVLKNNIELIAKPEWSLELSLQYYDSAKIYPNLVGTEHEFYLYKRWQLEIKNLTHKAREYLIKYFENEPLSYLQLPIVVYSES